MSAPFTANELGQLGQDYMLSPSDSVGRRFLATIAARDEQLALANGDRDNLEMRCEALRLNQAQTDAEIARLVEGDGREYTLVCRANEQRDEAQAEVIKLRSEIEQQISIMIALSEDLIKAEDRVDQLEAGIRAEADEMERQADVDEGSGGKGNECAALALRTAAAELRAILNPEDKQ